MPTARLTGENSARSSPRSATLKRSRHYMTQSNHATSTTKSRWTKTLILQRRFFCRPRSIVSRVSRPTMTQWRSFVGSPTRHLHLLRLMVKSMFGMLLKRERDQGQSNPWLRAARAIPSIAWHLIRRVDVFTQVWASVRQTSGCGIPLVPKVGAVSKSWMVWKHQSTRSQPLRMIDTSCLVAKRERFVCMTLRVRPRLSCSGKPIARLSIR
mmetsp:Transcript_29168/g.51002  ORF Transcript_29168/g.51002 Transcript_29168/m.51002 type:complete len:211 (-) Transcript_29168:809-1441(-)